jgi:putative endonuclease
MMGDSKQISRSELALQGEGAAKQYLINAGFRIRSERARTRWGEIDLVAEEKGIIVFVEVKTRRSDRFGSPEESVTPAKQKRLARLAAGYLAREGLSNADCRFDVVAVDLTPGSGPSLRHLRDAFRT